MVVPAASSGARAIEARKDQRAVSPVSVHIALILSPFLAIPLVSWAGGRRMGWSVLPALIPGALAVYFANTVSAVSRSGPFNATADWAPALHLSLSFRFDGLSTIFATLITAVGTLIAIYAAKYLEGHPHAGRFNAALFAFMGSMLGLVLSDNVIAMFVFWELTGFTSYLLIGFEHERPAARRAATQALLVTGGGGLALLAAGFLMLQAGGTAQLSALAAGGSMAAAPTYRGIVSLLLLAAFTKSAQFPFHFWLPNAMQAPTPVSAYLHSATMVKAGVYLVARMTPIVGGTALWTEMIVIFGAVTMVVGAARATTETDLKRILAYSTISALGILMLLFGIGTPVAVTAGLVYLLAHACYKGALFLVAGAVEHETGTRDVSLLTGLRAAMPATALAAALAALSMAGVPLFAGFIAKEQLYDTVQLAAVPGAPRGLLLIAAVAGSMCLGAAGLVAGIGPFRGRSITAPAVHEAPSALWLGPLILAVTGLILGLVPSLLSGPIAVAAGAVTGTVPAVNLALWHGVTVTLALSAVTLAGSVILFAYRRRLWPLEWPAVLHAERLYSGSLAILDALSRRIAPVLQSASLRAYVMVITVTAVALVAAGLETARILPAPRRWTAVQFHEAALAALILAGALSAVLAGSTMAAVLSLGVVGYGVAVMYALLGAPDLAMTQFAVETLTVVLFVLVFSKLRGFGDLSSRFVKCRDALVAIAAGAVVTTLVLFIGSSGTTSRLSTYFADAAPRLAHGANVVNVILVDFRGFDTLGETTVLVTVAIGVRALLLIGRERPQ
jgi:multicomponent Na+:H+ antiporter subunit A